MEELMKQVNKLIRKTKTDPRLKEEADEMDQWMQQSQPPLLDSNYSSANEEEQETKDEETKEIVGEGETEKNHDFFPTEKSIAKRKKVRYTVTRIKYSPTRVKSKNFFEQHQLQHHQQSRLLQSKLYTGRFYTVG